MLNGKELTEIPAIIGVRMRARINENNSYANETVQFCFGSNVVANLYEKTITVTGVTDDTIPSITQWTDLEFILNTTSNTGVYTGVYRIGDAEGTFSFNDANIQYFGFVVAAGVDGFYVDDLQVYTCEPSQAMRTVTASVIWDDDYDYDGARPSSVDLTLNGETVEVTADTNWSAVFKVPAFDENGAVIQYSADATATAYSQVEGTDDFSVTLYHQPVLHATNKENATTTAYFYNDYEGYLDENGVVLANPKNNFYTGAGFKQNGQLMSIKNKNKNNYLCIEVVEGSADAYYQGEFMQGMYTGGDFVVHMKLSTNGTAPAGTTLQYRYGSDASNTEPLFKITSSKINSQAISSNGWVSVDIVLNMPQDGNDGTYDLYINGTLSKAAGEEHTGTLKAPVNSYKISSMRLYIPRSYKPSSSTDAIDNNGCSLLVDDFIIYPGTDRLTVDQVNSPGYYYTGYGYEVPDVAAEAQWSKDNATVDGDLLADAMNEAETPWPAYRHDYAAMKSANALYYMVLAVNLNKVGTLDIDSVAQEAADRIRYLVDGGNEPWASVGTSWGHGVVASTMTLAKNTSTIWDKLTADEKAKVDLLMECLAIAANWGYNTQNDYKTGFAMDFHFDKKANPNIVNAYLTCYLNAAMYFDADGNHDGNELDDILEAFDYNSYISRLTAANFTNILDAWTRTDNGGKSIGDYMEDGGEFYADFEGSSKYAGSGLGVKRPFSYTGLVSGTTYYSNNLTEIFIDAVKHTYSWAVVSSYNSPADDSYSYIVGGQTDPLLLGKMGMMREFASGKRSDAFYCYLGAANIAPLYANMKLLGYWNYSNSEMLKMDNRIYVGTKDLFYKLEKGYHGYTDSKTAFYSDKSIVSSGGIYIEDIFNNFHFKNHEQ